MRIKANGVEVPLNAHIVVVVEVDPAGEVFPPLTITAAGGKLDVYRTQISTTGTVDFHLFGQAADGGASGT